MYGSYAFGNPDGAKAEITDLMSDFIVFDKKYFSSGVASADDLFTRIIVGAKGAGKSSYLKRLQANLKQQSNVYVKSIEVDAPATNLVIDFGKKFDASLINEKWMDVWKFAILRAVISNMLKNDEWNQTITEHDKERLLEYEEIIFPEYKVPMTIYAEAKNILATYVTKNDFNLYSQKKEWDEIETIVSQILKKLLPIYFFIDSIDEEYESAPTYWLNCQIGLFHRIMRFLRKDVYKDKLQVVISMRDSVMASICESENSTKYLHDKHVNLLNWDYRTIQYFFESKIKNLNDCYFINEGYNKTIENWLGLDKIHNEYRNIDEPVIQYILRHTRFLPRDIVNLGNSLAELKRMKYNNPALDINKIIRKKVADYAKEFGNELINICATQIDNNLAHNNATNQMNKERSITINDLKRTTSQRIKEILYKTDPDNLNWDCIVLLKEEADKLLGNNCRMFDVLWQNGGIGYKNEGPNGEVEVFFNQKSPEFRLPKQEKSSYILRSCLIDAIGIHNKNWSQNPTIGGYLD